MDATGRKGKPQSGKKKEAPPSALAQALKAHLVAHAPQEDLEGYSKAEIARAAALAAEALGRHRKGGAIVAVEPDSFILRAGRPVTIITIVNDNMPFLFDSVLGEIVASAGEPVLAVHPVLLVRRGRGGVTGILDEGKAGGKHDAVSFIHVHVTGLSAGQAAELADRLETVLAQVHAAVGDWKPMLARLDLAIEELHNAEIALDTAAVVEAAAFLKWLRDDNFTFLGMREFEYSGGRKNGTLTRSEKPGLGILTDPDVMILRRGNEATTTTPELRAFLHGPEPIIVTKANAKSVVHRRVYLDYVGVKTFDARGRLAGELRIVGLFTSTAYTRSVQKIPYLRSKTEAVLDHFGFGATDHSGKALINILESYPRDELFQVPVETLLRHAATLLGLIDRPRVKVLLRIDQFDRFVSAIVFVPRDRYDSDVREKIGLYLKTAFEGRVSAYYPAFPEEGLARVHFIIGRSGGKTPNVDPASIEAAIRDLIRTWEDALREAADQSGAAPALLAAANAFPEAYRDAFSPAEALQDARIIAGLSAGNAIAIDFYRRPGQAPEQAALKIYHHGSPVPLSRRVPLLENMGFRVISEQTIEIGGADGEVFLHDMDLENAFAAPIDLADGGTLFDRVFLAVWHGEADNDGYNGLGQSAGLAAPAVAVLRAYGRYLQQAGIAQSQDFIAAALNRYPTLARGLHSLFMARLDPAAGEKGAAEARHLKVQIVEDLENVPSIDDDTIIRRFLNLIEATVRTNHFMPDLKERGFSLALKFESRKIAGLPDPKPWHEIFVYGPEVEGVHLRFGPVARGGLRLSDRAQDYRTEVLGLVKAQQVKNAVIVPVGAKGGFFPKRLPKGGSREAVFEAGRSAYVNFVSSMLSITDNLEGDKVVPPQNVVRLDGDDPYFVVAADKGTATFSDTANKISQDHGYWLDDAFASGGSAGYDHKKMGITARGAWEAVKRHFREINRDIQTTPFTAVGVGDMSGDVFGNGMMRSPMTRLIAAFDHRDIFIDPDPDPAAAFEERKRLFALPRSSWQDYDKARLSKGGMVASRSQKTVTLTEEAAAAIGLGKTVASPAEIMSAILKAEVDLLWFGGIGTYVKAADESNLQVGDRANDAIRIDGGEVRASVIGEGANLGVTPRGRIEYALKGGRNNSDAIDNSAGVNCSDVEVNIKIALAAAMRKRKLSRKARNGLLAEMTDEVAALVLANNYRQPLALSLQRRRGLADLPHQARFMEALEARGLLDRAVENLPTTATLAARAAHGEPLTRPELAVLLAYAKLSLFSDIVASDVPDAPHFERDLLGYFPQRMQRRYAAEIRGHRLRREIIARVVANELVDRGGPSFVNRLQEATGRSAADVVRAFTIVHEGFDLRALYGEIDALDNEIGGEAQLDLYGVLGRLIFLATSWYLRNGREGLPIDEEVAALRQARKTLEPGFSGLLPAFPAEKFEGHRHGYFKAGAPEKLAARLALADYGALIPDIALVARASGTELKAAARAFFAVSEAFRIAPVEDAASGIAVSDYYDGLALSRALETIGQARRGITIGALRGFARASDPAAAWLEAGGGRVATTRERLKALTESGEVTVSRLSVAAGLMADLVAG